MTGRTPWLLLLGLTAFLRLPNLWFPVQGDDAFYLAMAQHGLVDPVHPNHFELIAQGSAVDMRGFPKPPGNTWMLAGLLAGLGDFSEVPFHAAYAVFTLLALWAVWALAAQFCSSPRWAVALFAAVPAFVINGNSLEADVPFVAFFLAALALLVRGNYAASGVAGAVAALIEYKAVALVPIAGLYVWRERRGDLRAWAAAVAPALMLAAWQIFERASTGAASAQVLAGYFQSRGLQSASNKLRNALALTVHLGWIVSPVLSAAWFGRRDWVVALVAAGVGGFAVDASPLFWVPLGCGVAILLRSLSTEFPSAWIALFFAFALAAFFAGSARYLLPLAAPLVIVTVNKLNGRNALLAIGFVLHMALALALNQANREHWDGYRSAIERLAPSLAAHRSWIASEWGLRFYAESAGAAPLKRGQAVPPGDIVVTSRIGQPIDYTSGGGVAVALQQFPVQPRLPMRIMAEGSPSAYSTHERGFRAFDVSTRPADVVTAWQIAERAPVLSYLPMNAPEAAFQLAAGVYALEQNAWRWTALRVVALVKPPASAATVEATFRIIDQSPVRAARLSVDGRVVAEQKFLGPGLYTLKSAAPILAGAPSATVILSFDTSFHPPGDARELAAILTGIGFTPAIH